MSEWIEIKSQKPPVNTDILVYDRYNDMFVAYLSEFGHYSICCNCHEGSHCDPIYWKELPKRPNDSMD
jgi:hypothetical protein